jgi:hypothetical protein
MIYRLITAIMVVTLTGCAALTSPYQLTVDDYMTAVPKISLGMSKSDVIELLQPTQVRLKNTDIKQPDMYKKDGTLVEILYFRSGWQPDELTTDDEFTPYLFNDGELVAVGWATLGGPKTQGQAAPETNVHTTTIVHPTGIIY